MIRKRDLMVAVLCTFVLTSVLLMVTTTRSQTEEYDPWIDINDDGAIDIYDLIAVGSNFGATGLPLNKTALLELDAKIDLLNATLTQQIEDLETEIYAMNATKLGKPDYDSGWQSVIAGDTLIPHTCNTTDVIVYIVGKQDGGTSHQKDYGGWQGNLNWYGAYWYDLTDTHIRVHRHGNDGDWQLVRIFMWKIP